MSAPAQVTEAHRVLARHLSTEAESVPHLCDLMAQAIADSEARAIAEINTSLDAAIIRAWGISAERDQLKDRIERAELQLKDWNAAADASRQPNAFYDGYSEAQMRAMQAMLTKAEAELAKERARLDWLYNWGYEYDGMLEKGWGIGLPLNQKSNIRDIRAAIDAIKAILIEEKARADEAEHDCRVLIGQLNDALAELDGIRALAGRNKRYCFKGTARELVAALDQALDIAQAELKAEQDIRVINEIELKVSRAIVSKIWVQLGSPTYEQLKGRSIYDLIDELKAELAKERARLDWLMAGGVCMVQHTGGFHVSRLHAPVSRAAIDDAMKEETK